MNSKLTPPEQFDEKQSLQVIKEMIEVARNKMRHDGILLIVWGWFLVASNLYYFLHYRIDINYPYGKYIDRLLAVGFIATVGYTIYYIVKQRRKVKTYIGISLRYIWISFIVCLMLVNVIQFNVLHTFNAQLQHPIFMVFSAFAILVTGVILRHEQLISGGVVFGFLAFVSSYLTVDNQLFFEAIGWIIAFVIPGHLLYAKRKKKGAHV
jgi:membrane-associated HD superfamily phosphohydrolase